ncbi:hypothetical protein Syun_009461 [Stephania yunnanensis]|uniref:Uncharacterized protein n=1 Tax=Stephania yunnanensis TaxID=152371 RepID=A0AAP0KEP4_9MAGN
MHSLRFGDRIYCFMGSSHSLNQFAAKDERSLCEGRWRKYWRLVLSFRRSREGFAFQTYMARSKIGVSRERVYEQYSRTERAAGTLDTRGGRKPQTTLYRKEKQKATEKKVARARFPRGDSVQDETSQVHERDLLIGRDESGG